MRSWIVGGIVIFCVILYGVAAIYAPIVLIHQAQKVADDLAYHGTKTDRLAVLVPEEKMCMMPADSKLGLLDITRDQPGFELAIDLDQIDEYREPRDLVPLVTAKPKVMPVIPIHRPLAVRGKPKKRDIVSSSRSVFSNRTVTGNGGKLILEPRTMRMFQQLEAAWGEKLTVRWAYRDKTLNKRVGGAGRSMHLEKKAIDIVHGGWSKFKMLRFVRLAYKIGFRGFGLGRNVIHLDTRPKLASWNYGGNVYGSATRMVK